MLASPRYVGHSRSIAYPRPRSPASRGSGSRSEHTAKGRAARPDRAGTAEGQSNHRLAKELNTSRPTILLWRQRYAQAGLSGLLKDAPRPGRRKQIGAPKVEAIVNATLQTRPRDATHWSVRTMARAQGVSPATVHRIWEAHGLQPHRTETFKLSRDPTSCGSCAM